MAENQSYAERFAATQKQARESMTVMAGRPDPAAAKVQRRLDEQSGRQAGRE